MKKIIINALLVIMSFTSLTRTMENPFDGNTTQSLHHSRAVGRGIIRAGDNLREYVNYGKYPAFLYGVPFITTVNHEVGHALAGRLLYRSPSYISIGKDTADQKSTKEYLRRSAIISNRFGCLSGLIDKLLIIFQPAHFPSDGQVLLTI